MLFASAQVVMRPFAAASLLLSTVLLPGCATRADGSTVTIVDDAQVLAMSDDGLSDVERRQLERVQRYAEMRIQGMVAGTAMGFLAGLTAGGDNRAIAVTSGVLVGAHLGYLAGAYVARLNETAEDRRDDLEVQLAAAKETVADTQRAVADNREIVRAERRRIERLNEEHRAGRITATQYRDQLGDLEKRMTIVDESLRVAEGDVKAIEKSVQWQRDRNVNPAALEKQRAALEREVATLRAERDSLLATVGTIPPDVGAPAV
jgi:outer membrane lipoprotein SlyB